MFLSGDNSLKARKTYLWVCLSCFLCFSANLSISTAQAQTSKSISQLFWQADYPSIEASYSESPTNWNTYYYIWSMGIESVLSGEYLTYEQNEEEILSIIKSREGEKDWDLFLREEGYLVLSLMRLRFGDELLGVWSFRQSYQLARTIETEFPQFLYINKSLGFMEMMLGAIPDDYRWLLDMLGWEGNTKSGMALLSSMENDEKIGWESSALLALYQAYLLQDFSDARRTIRGYLLNEQSGELMRLCYLAIMHKAGKALEVMNYHRNDSKLPHSHYLYAEAALQSGEYQLAIENYERFMAAYSGSDLIKDCHYKIFVAHFLSGEDQKAEKAKENIILLGDSRVEADRYALIFFDRGENPVPEILKLRLATDGGLYDKAFKLVQLLERMEERLSERQKLEFIYRKARLYHLSGNLQQAQNSYLKTINLQGDEPYYFAANASLQLGMIYYDNTEYKLAEEYFKKASRYNNHEYKNSIRRKSKAMLSKIKGERISQE